jgi:cardiolipin synthase
MSVYFELWAIAALGILAWLLFLVLFEPGLAYRLNAELPDARADAFLPLLSGVIDEPVLEIAHFEVLKNGAVFYPTELAAIRQATASVHIEAFIFHATPIGQRFVAALAERARAGVQVRIVVDAVGSMLTPDRFFDELRAAGGKVAWYQPLRWYTFKRYNNRTHRELIVVDGRVAFIGGAGIAAHWDSAEGETLPWRDTMVRLEGPAAAALQSVFLENWLESSGEVLVDESTFPSENRYRSPSISGERLGLVVGSNPSAGRSSRARLLFQLLLGGARASIRINSPYFLPDHALRRELIRAAQRGVEVTVVVPGRYNNHLLARYASRRYYGELLAAGVRIFEYQPGMIHAKTMIIDATWTVVGSTNFDSRSFELNDEVNLIVYDRTIAARFAGDFAEDLHWSKSVSLPEWRSRSLGERLLAVVGKVLERQE